MLNYNRKAPKVFALKIRCNIHFKQTLGNEIASFWMKLTVSSLSTHTFSCSIRYIHFAYVDIHCSRPGYYQENAHFTGQGYFGKRHFCQRIPNSIPAK